MTNREETKTLLRLLAGIAATMILAYLVLMFVGETIPSEASPQVMIALVVTLLCAILLVGFVYALRWMSLRRDVAHGVEELSERLRKTERMLKETESLLAHKIHTYYVFETIKETTILNDRGDSDVKYSFRCKNNPDKELPRIRVNISHDGRIEEKSLSCSLDGKKIEASVIQRFVTMDEETEKEIEIMPKTLRFFIEPDTSIPPDADFTYDYAYRMGALYPKIKIKGEEYTQILIMHATHRLRYVVKAPPNFVFTPDIKVEVIDRDDVEYVAEERRIHEECPPTLIDDGKILLWDIIEPRLANVYRLHLLIKAESDVLEQNTKK